MNRLDPNYWASIEAQRQRRMERNRNRELIHLAVYLLAGTAIATGIAKLILHLG